MNGEEVLAPSLLLAASSPLLQSALHPTDPDQEACVLLPDVSAEHLKIFIDKLLLWSTVPRYRNRARIDKT